MEGIRGGHKVFRKFLYWLYERYNAEVTLIFVGKKGNLTEITKVYKVPPFINQFLVIPLKLNKIDQYLYSYSKTLFSTTYFKALKKIFQKNLERIDYDIFINSTGKYPFFIRNEFLYLQPGVSDIYYGRFIYDFLRRLYWSSLRSIRKELRERVRKGDLLIAANSSFIKSFFERIWGKVSIKVIYPPLEIDVKNIKTQINSVKKIVSFGRFVYGKGFEDLIDVWKYLKEENLEITLAGKSEDKNYIRMLKRKAIRMRAPVNFRFDLRKEEIDALFSSSDIVVYTSKFEPFGLALVESMAYGLAPIVHKSGGPWIDIVALGKFGLGYSSIEELASKIYELLNNESKLQELRKIAFYRACLLYTSPSPRD